MNYKNQIFYSLLDKYFYSKNIFMNLSKKIQDLKNNVKIIRIKSEIFLEYYNIKNKF